MYYGSDSSLIKFDLNSGLVVDELNLENSNINNPIKNFIIDPKTFKFIGLSKDNVLFPVLPKEKTINKPKLLNY